MAQRGPGTTEVQRGPDTPPQAFSHTRICMQRDISGHVTAVHDAAWRGSSDSDTAAVRLGNSGSARNALSEGISFTPSFHPKRVHRPDRTMLYSFVLYILLCSWAMAAPLSLLRGNEPDGLTKVEPGQDSWFAHGGGDGLLGNLGDVLSGTLLDGMSGEQSLPRAPGLVRRRKRLNKVSSQATLSTPTAPTP